MLRLLLSRLILIAALAASASARGTSSGQQDPPEPYGGVVVNQSVTVAGHDFYQHFALAWRENPMSERFAVSVHEQPSARWGSRVWIEFRQRRIFQANLPPGRAAIKSISLQAVEIAQQRVMDAEVDRLLFRDVDLAADEI